ncbi:hypothetical protein [Streptomyces erythrochromogenes]|uniref:hypothetical protein n=1 Tax=Streptomyces erythrochromogenes TaxID=285574 RepID=UPI0036BA889F
MSRRTDNRHRVATICRAATGLPHHTCLHWAETGLITRHRPVPDATAPAQRALEAKVFLQLCADPLEGALLGITRVEPEPDGLHLWMDPGAARQVVALLLPRFDMMFGGMGGIPGLRPVADGGGLRLHSLLDGTSVVLRHPHPDWTSSFFAGAACDAHVWRHAPKGLDDSEREWLRTVPVRDARPDPDRDWLLSRLIRRSRLLSAGGSAHRCVGRFSAEGRELAIEWCSAGAADLAVLLRRSGLAAGHGPAGSRGGRTLALGAAAVTVRRSRCEAHAQRSALECAAC